MTARTAVHQTSLSFTISWGLLKFMSIELLMLSNHFTLCHVPLPPALNHPQHQSLFQWTESSHQMAKILELQHVPSNEYSELISFRIDWFDLLAVQGLSKSFSSITIQKHQFLSTQPSLESNSHIHTWLPEKSYLWLRWPLSAKWCPCLLICCLGLS